MTYKTKWNKGAKVTSAYEPESKERSESGPRCHFEHPEPSLSSSFGMAAIRRKFSGEPAPSLVQISEPSATAVPGTVRVSFSVSVPWFASPANRKAAGVSVSLSAYNGPVVNAATSASAAPVGALNERKNDLCNCLMAIPNIRYSRRPRTHEYSISNLTASS